MNWRCLARSVSLSDTLPDDELSVLGLQAHDIVAGRAFDIVEIEMHRRAVAGSRKRGSVAVSTTGSRIMTSPAPGRPCPCSRRPPSRAQCRRRQECRTRRPRCRRADLDDAGIERERRLRRRRAFKRAPPCVAAGADLRRARPACRRSARHRGRGFPRESLRWPRK